MCIEACHIVLASRRTLSAMISPTQAGKANAGTRSKKPIELNRPPKSAIEQERLRWYIREYPELMPETS